MRRGTIPFVTALVALAALLGSALWAQEPEASYTPEGAWLMKGAFGPSTPIWMDTYTSNSTNQGRSGTVLCTLPILVQTETGQGVWVRIEKNKFAFTAWRIVVNRNTQPIQPTGFAKYWGTVTLTTNDTMTGTMNVQVYDLQGNVLSTMTGGTSTGTRIQIQYE